MNWIQNYPVSMDKNELLNLPLMISEDKPPKDTNIGGLKEIIIFSTKNTGLAYRIMATNQEIDIMVEAYKQMKPFTFQDTGGKYPDVVIMNAKIRKDNQADLPE